MTNAILYGTTSDNNLKPVRCSDSGELIVEGGDSYWTLIGDTIETTYAISVNNNFGVDINGNVQTGSNIYWGELNDDHASQLYKSGDIVVGNNGTSSGEVKATSYVGLYGSTGLILSKSAVEGDFARAANDTVIAVRWGDPYPFTVTCDGTVTCKTVIDREGYELSNVVQGLIALRNAVLATSDLDELKALIFSTLMEIKPVPVPPPFPPE